MIQRGYPYMHSINCYIDNIQFLKICKLDIRKMLLSTLKSPHPVSGIVGNPEPQEANNMADGTCRKYQQDGKHQVECKEKDKDLYL